MNKTIQLVNLWGEFEAKHPEADIEDFCRYYLTSRREKKNQGKLFNGLIPPTDKIILSKLIQRIATIQQNYANSSLHDVPVKQLEEFIVLNAVAHLKEGKKTEVIYTSLLELSTGLNILSNLLKQGFIIEEEDKEDKRSKRVKITAKGEEVLQSCYKEMRKANSLVFQDMEEEDIALTIQLLKNVDIKFSALWQQHKGKSFDEVLASMKESK
ncbi:MAG TPA: winged helix DNA-binding protein [Cytophagaceae bacterium]|jgi:DNA-binding MarR family transcriptional regulator|nr:winged helix DNA-binding protein [Cytophagaceae bacterium]